MRKLVAFAVLCFLLAAGPATKLPNVVVGILNMVVCPLNLFLLSLSNLICFNNLKHKIRLEIRLRDKGIGSGGQGIFPDQ